MIFKKYFRFDNNLALNTSSLYFIYSINFLISIIILPKLISNYGIKSWGEITFCQIVINYFIWFIDWSFPQYACKSISINDKKNKERGYIFSITRTSQLILLIISSILILFYGIFISNHELVYIYANLILIGNFLQSYWYLNGREKIYESAILQLINKLIFTFLILNYISVNSSIEIYFLLLGISSLITGFLCTGRIVFKYGERLEFSQIDKSIELIKESFMLFNSSIIGNLTTSLIPILIGNYCSIEQLGIYNIADRIKNISIQVLNPISHSIFPKMTKKYFRSKKEGNNNFIRLIISITSIGIFVLILLNLNIDIVINYFSKNNLSDIREVLKILCFSFLINIIYETFINHYLVINNLYKEINKTKLLIFFTAIIFGLPLIYFKGILGAAITNLIYEIIGLSLVIKIFQRTKTKSYFIK
tara:strand:+ start:8433 stop:9695 length:1263 start_codon:yes stop_codon:yes gene_type:complete